MSFLNFFRTRKRLTVYAIVFLVVAVLSVFIVHYISKNRTVYYICRSGGFAEGEETAFRISLTGDVLKTRHHSYKCRRYFHNTLQCASFPFDNGIFLKIIFDKENPSFYYVMTIDRALLPQELTYFTDRYICHAVKSSFQHHSQQTFNNTYDYNNDDNTYDDNNDDNTYYDNKYGGCIMSAFTCRRKKKHHWWSNII